MLLLFLDLIQLSTTYPARLEERYQDVHAIIQREADSVGCRVVKSISSTANSSS